MSNIFQLHSNSFNDGDYLSKDHALSTAYGFGCDGGNISPELHWENTPKETKSLALTMFDPDAPTGSGFWHWSIINMPANTKNIPLGISNQTNSTIPGLETRTDFGKSGYGGPCPPEGNHPHRYIFTIYAVSVASLDVNEETSAAVIGFQLNFNTIKKATLMGLFKR